jgi:hypothetical protein
MAPPAGEAGLILVLAGGVCLHHWRRLLGGVALAPANLHTGPLLPRLAFAALALALPAAAFLLVRHLRGWGRRPEVAASRLRLSLYALLPLLWALMLADHLDLGMAEAGLLLPVSSSPWWPQLAGRLPAWSADVHVIAFCQSLVVAVGVVGSVVLLRRLLQPMRWGWLALGWLALGLGAGGRWLVAAG